MTDRARGFAWPMFVAVAVLAGVPPGHADDSAAKKPDFSGRWQLDEKASDPAPARGERGGWGEREGGGAGSSGGGGRMGGPGGGMGGPGGGMGGPGGGMGGPGGGPHGGKGGPGGGGGRGGPDGGTPPSPEWRQHMRHVFAADTLEIASQGDDISIVYPDGDIRALKVDGSWTRPKGGATKSSTDKKAAKGEMEERASWEGLRLVVESKVEGGPSTHETFELSPDGSVLTEMLRIEGGHMPGHGPRLRVYRRPGATDKPAPADAAAK